MLGSYFTVVAAAHGYNMTVFYLHGCSAWLNLPHQLDGAALGADLLKGRKEDSRLTIVAIRKKVADVSVHIDALRSDNGGGIHFRFL
jgi:hypothetical protein